MPVSAVCVFNSLEGHFHSISIRLGVLIEHQPALTSVLLVTLYEKGFFPAAAALMEFLAKQKQLLV